MQDVHDRDQKFLDQQARSKMKEVSYQQAATVMKPTAVEGEVAVAPGIDMANVDAKGLEATAHARYAPGQLVVLLSGALASSCLTHARWHAPDGESVCSAMGMKEQAGVAVPAEVHGHFVQPTGDAALGGADARVVAPDAIIGGGSSASSSASFNEASGSRKKVATAGLDGHLVDPKYAPGVADAVGTTYGVETTVQPVAGKADTYGTKTDAYGAKTDAYGTKTDAYTTAETKGTKEKTGLVGKIKNKLHI